MPSHLSTEYIRVPVNATENGTTVDPTSENVEMAFVALGTDPDTGDWNEAEWETANSRYYARCLVGPDSDVTLEEGSYWPWVRLGGPSPEAPVLRARGPITIT